MNITTEAAEQRFREATLRRTAWIIYIGWLISPILGYFAIILDAYLLYRAYASLEKSKGTVYQSHLKNYITIFWAMFILAGAASLLYFLALESVPSWVITAFAILAVGISLWAIYRSVKGMLRLSELRAMT